MAKDSRGHLREEAAHKRFNLQFFSTMISGLWLLAAEVQLSMHGKEDTKVVFVGWCVGPDFVQ